MKISTRISAVVLAFTLGACASIEDRKAIELAQRAESSPDVLTDIVLTGNEDAFGRVNMSKVSVYAIDDQRKSVLEYAMVSPSRAIRSWGHNQRQENNTRAAKLFEQVEDGMTLDEFQEYLRKNPIYLNATASLGEKRLSDGERFDQSLFTSLIASGYDKHAHHLFNLGADPFHLDSRADDHTFDFQRRYILCGDNPQLVWDLMEYGERRGNDLLRPKDPVAMRTASRCRPKGTSSPVIVKGLIDRGASTEIGAGRWDTPLIYDVATYRDGEILEVFLDDQGDALVRREFGSLNSTLLFSAARTRNVSTVKVLLERGSDPNFRRPSDGTGVMATAIGRNGYFPGNMSALEDKERLIITLLTHVLDYGGDINGTQNDYVGTPLMHAAFWGFKDLAVFLIDRGGDRTMTNAKGKTAADIAKSRGHDHMLDIL